MTQQKFRPSRENSRFVIVAALAANVGITAVKAAAAAATGSAGMLSEAIHSLVDSGNELLLFLGLSRASKAPDADHSFGYGKELYFWSFVVALMVFALGGLVSIGTGVLHIQNPHPVENIGWSFAVLAAAAVFESTSFVIAYRQFKRGKRPRGLLAGIHTSKDPSIFIVLLEDGAAIAGISLAALGLALSALLGNPVYDGIASLAIGLLLVGVAGVLGNECRGLLIGESLRTDKVDEIRALLQKDRGVERVDEILSMHLGPHEVLLNLRMHFREELDRTDLQHAIERVVRKIHAARPEVSRIFFASDSFCGEK